MKTLLKISIILVSALLLIHSHLFAEKITIVAVGDLYELSANKAGRGGYAKLATIVKNAKKNVDRAFFIHAGDAFSPSIVAGLVKGQQAVDHLNQMQLDYFVLGNHEFDFGVKRMHQLLEQANFMTLAANVRNADGTRLKRTQDYDIVQVGEFKLAFIGVTREESVVLSSTGKTVFNSAYDTAVKLADRAKKEGADFIVLIAHTPFNEDYKLLNTKKFDLLISGDDHYVLAFDNGKERWIESGEDAEFVVQAHIELKKDKKGRTQSDVSLEVIDTKNISADPQISKISADYENRLSKELDIVLLKTKGKLDSRKPQVRSVETVIGNIIADAMRKSVDADIAIANGGGIRGNKVYSAGYQLKKKDVLTELPFGNVVVKIEMSGAAILEALENGVSQAPVSAGRFPQVSGLVFTWDANAASGKRIKKVRINGQHLESKKLYSVATNNYMQNGGDGYQSMKNAKVLIDSSGAKLLASTVMEYLSSQKNIDYTIQNRIIKK